MKAANEAAFQDAMRKLWEDHITWTRVFIISAVGGLPDKDAATQRLLQNQVDIGNAIKPYYGNAAGDQLAALPKDHIVMLSFLISERVATHFVLRLVLRSKPLTGGHQWVDPLHSSL